jgi:hypothetical protein
MREIFSRSLNGTLRKLTAEIHALDRRLKSNPSLDGAALREFRQALDNVRLTAWSVNELLNARQSGKNQQAVMSFLTAERLRRFSQMARDLSGDLEHDGTSWPSQAVRDLEGSLAVLGARLTMIGESEDAAKALT